MSIGVAKWVFQQFPITVQELSAASRLEIKREELLLGMKMPEGSSRSQVRRNFSETRDDYYYYHHGDTWQGVFVSLGRRRCETTVS